MGIFDIVYAGFWSLVGGLLTSLFIVGATLLWAVNGSRRKQLEPLALILGVVMFLLLTYQSTLLYGAIGSRSVAIDLVSACALQFDGYINGEELSAVVMSVIRDNPLISFFVDYSDLQNFDWSDPIASLREVVGREYNYFILRRLGWIAFITILFGTAIVLTSRSGSRKRSRRPSTRRVYDEYE